MRCAAVLIKLPRITILPYLLSHMKACSKRQTYPRIKGVCGDGCHSVSVKRCQYHIVFAMVFSITHCCVNFIKASCYSI